MLRWLSVEMMFFYKRVRVAVDTDAFFYNMPRLLSVEISLYNNRLGLLSVEMFFLQHVEVVVGANIFLNSMSRLL